MNTYLQKSRLVDHHSISGQKKTGMTLVNMLLKMEMPQPFRKFKTEFHDLRERTVRTFKKRYYEEVRKGKEKLDESKKIHKYRRKTGRPYLLGDLDEMVQQHLLSLSKKEV